jgi:hypothetical protein
MGSGHTDSSLVRVGTMVGLKICVLMKNLFLESRVSFTPLKQFLQFWILSGIGDCIVMSQQTEISAILDHHKKTQEESRFIPTFSLCREFNG